MPSFGSAGGYIRLAPHVPQLHRLASASGLHRLLSPSGFTGRRPLGLRLAISSPVEPPMHSLFPPNLASPAKPSMSIPFPPALASSGIIQLNNFRLASAFVTSGASSDPSAACASGFTLCPGLRPSLRFSPAVRSVNLAGDQLPACADCLFFQLPATNSDALSSHQLNETLRPFNLWKQVQKSSKFVDFTMVGAML